jgi:hypothetical protein
MQNLSGKFKEEDFRFKFFLITGIVLLAISFFYNKFTNRDPFNELSYIFSFLYLLPAINISVNYIKNEKKILSSFLVGLLIVTLSWLAFFAFIALILLTIDYSPFEFKKMSLFDGFLFWFFIMIPLSLFYTMGVLIWLMAPIHYLSECFEKNKKFKFPELFTRKSFGDFAVNPFKLLFMYFSLPWLFIRFLLRSFLGINK